MASGVFHVIRVNNINENSNGSSNNFWLLNKFKDLCYQIHCSEKIFLYHENIRDKSLFYDSSAK